MSHLMLDDYINRNPDSVVVITHDALKIKLVGILKDSQLSSNLSATYDGSSIQDGMGQASNALNTFAQMGGGKFNKIAGVIGKGVNVMSQYASNKHTLMGTVKTYSGSGDINLPINVSLFYGWQGNPSFKEMELVLNKMTQPMIYTGGIMGTHLYNPKDLLGLATLSTDLFSGKLLNFSIGNWFRATDVYVTQLAKNYLTYTNEDALPVALEVNFQISPYRQLSAEELTNWIK